MSDELKPCPFCGGEKASVYPQTCRQSDPYDPTDRAFPIVRCGKCFAEVGGENFPHRFGDVSSAITAWNTRANPTVKPLDWQHFDAWTYWAETPFNIYRVNEREGRWTCTAGPLGTSECRPLEAEYDNTEEAAKVAAQADYERRILDALK